MNHARPVPTRPSAGDMLAEIVPLVAAIPAAGPPVVLLACPWIFLALILAGPFAVLLTLVIFMLAVLALVAALAATPYLLVRHVRGARLGSSRAR
ncbi:MAG TPA: hypothetical protein VFZ00_07245, partial [Solirubrobacter sp.]|nr:hypothetical protein [Solirubrobacter sp.]